MGLREQLKDGQASAAPGRHRRGESTLCKYLEERQQPMQRSWVVSKEKQGGQGAGVGSGESGRKWTLGITLKEAGGHQGVLNRRAT